MKWLVLPLIFTSLGIRAAECDGTATFPCSADDALYSISIDAIQSTISKESVEINMTGGKGAEAENKTEEPLYTLSDQPAPGMPKFVKDKKTWYITMSRVSNARWREVYSKVG